MLTRLKIRGFKNLVDVDVAFGPFTCIAGANGVGKSNLFDANPLRQVVINTHSPAVVSIVAQDDILVAENRTEAINGSRTRGVVFSSLANTWRHRSASDPERVRVCSVDKVLSCLAPSRLASDSARARLIDRPEVREHLQLILPFGTDTR